jgi:hypothetical protein
VESSTGDGKVHLTVLSPNYLFFNHSCRANTSWHGTVPNVWVGDRGAEEEEVLKPGSGSVVCRAGGVIEEGEQLTISYVGDPMGDDAGDDAGDENGAEGEKNRKGKGREQKRGYLMKWFENGCGCEICEEENKVEKKNGEMRVEGD